MMFCSRYFRVQNEWSFTSSDSSAATFSMTGPTPASPSRGSGPS